MLSGIEKNHLEHHHGGFNNDWMISMLMMIIMTMVLMIIMTMVLMIIMTMMFRWLEGGSSHNHDHGVPNLMIMTMMFRCVMMMRMMMMMR